MILSSDKAQKTEFIAQKMVFGGSCLGKIKGKNVFVPYAIPGERLEIQIEKSFKDYDHAKIVRVLEPSALRVEPACPLYQKCGGCNMMHIDYQEQLRLKKAVVQELMEKAGVKIPKIELVYGQSLGYRSRFQLRDGGMEGRSTNDVVPTQSCPVAVGQINEWLMKEPMEKRPKGKGCLFGHQNAEPSLSFALKAESQKTRPPKKSGKKDKKHGNKAPKARFEGIKENEQCPVQIVVCGKKIAFDARGFFQSNIGMLEKSLPLILDGLSGKTALDMYSGAGTFSVFLADKFEKVVMVEADRAALVFAERNMAGLSHESYGISGADFARRAADEAQARLGGFDAALLDPPRAGIEKEALDWLCRSGIKTIKYLSCNPSSQSRDLASLEKSGYSITDLRLLDFYPQTSHIESLATCMKI